MRTTRQDGLTGLTACLLSAFCCATAMVACGSINGSDGTVATDPPTYDFIVAPTTNFGAAGVCGNSGEGTATAATYDGWEDLVVWGEEGLGDDIESRVCWIRFSLKRVGDAPAGCMGSAGPCQAAWLLEYSNPQMMKDEKGACAQSSYQLDSARIAKINGSRVAYGYDKECRAGHAPCRMLYSMEKKMWVGEASYGALDTTTNKFKYKTQANCTYKSM